MEKRTYTLSIFTENFTGLLHRVTTVFTKRKLNIESITASESEMKGIYRYTIVIKSTKEMAVLVAKQLEKQVDVVRACVHEEDEIVHQEIALYKVPTHALENVEIEKIIRDHHARILSFTPEFFVIEKTGHQNETQELYDLFHPFGLLEFVRSGRVAITKPMTQLIDHMEQMEENHSHKKLSEFVA